jgi:hypothetical protein
MVRTSSATSPARATATQGPLRGPQGRHAVHAAAWASPASTSRTSSSATACPSSSSWPCRGCSTTATRSWCPAPDYPLWTAAVTLAGGTSGALPLRRAGRLVPDLDDIRAASPAHAGHRRHQSQQSHRGRLRTRQLLDEIIAIAREHDLVLFADEIYDKILYDDAVHVPLGSLPRTSLTLTFNGLSKNYRAAGFRTGWMIVSGASATPPGLHRGAEHPREHAAVRERAHTARGADGPRRLPEHRDLCRPDGLWCRQRDAAHALLNQIPGVSCVKPRGRAVRVPAHRSRETAAAIQRRAFRPRPAAQRAHPGRPGDGVQLAAPGPLPARLPAARPDDLDPRGHAPRPLPRALPPVVRSQQERSTRRCPICTSTTSTRTSPRS